MAAHNREGERCNIRFTRAMEEQDYIPAESEHEEDDNASPNDEQRLNLILEAPPLRELRAPPVRQVYLIMYSQANIEKFPTGRSFAECVVAVFSHTGTGVGVLQGET